MRRCAHTGEVALRTRRAPGKALTLLAALGACAAWVAAPAQAGAAAPAVPAVKSSLRCSVSPRDPLLGHVLHWVIRARDLPELPMLRAQGLGSGWLLQGQQSERMAGAGCSSQTLRLELYPLAAGELALPRLRVGSRSCAARTLRIAPAAPGQAPRYLATRIDTGRPTVGQAVRVRLDAASDGGLVWQAPEARCDSGLLRPLGSVSTRIDSGGRVIEVQRWTWSFTPLRAGGTTIRFGLLRATRFGSLRVYSVPSLPVRVRALPAYWPAGAPVGSATLRVEPAPRRLSIGDTGVLRASLQGVQVGRQALSRLLDRTQATAGLRLYPARVSRQSVSTPDAAPRWRIELPFRVLRAGRLAYPQLRLAYYDPGFGAPRLASAGWGRLRADDPRPLRVVLACAGVGLLVLLLALSRLALPAVLAALRRRRLRRLAERGDVERMLLLWRRALARGEPHAATLGGWWAAVLRASRTPHDPELDALLAAAQQRLYGRPPVTGDDAPG